MTTIRRPRTLFAFGLVGAVLVLTAFAALALFAYGNSSGPKSTTENWPAGFDVKVGYLQTGKPVQWSIPLTDDPADRLTVYWVRQPSGEVWGLIARDPHSGCEVPWDRDYVRSNVNESGLGAFKALCSGWVFDTDGSVLFGAAARGLDRAVVTVAENGDDAHIDLTRFILGLCREPGQAGCSTETSPMVVTQLPKAAVSDWARAR